MSRPTMSQPTPERPEFDPGYGISDTPEGMLPWSWLSERMAESRNYWIGTTRPDGRPHAMPVWGIWLDGTLYFSTSRASAKARNLAHRPELVVHLESGDDVVILEGTVEELRDDSRRDRLREAYGSKYPWQAGPDDLELVFVVRPRRAYAWRETDYPSSATRFSFP